MSESGDSRTKAERCQATAANGKPCAATPRPGRSYCLWHDPEAVETRRELSRKGGQARSNRRRALAKLPDEVMSLRTVQAMLCRALRDVIDGRLEPGVGNSAATLGRAIAAIATAGDLEERVAELERAAGAAGFDAHTRGRA